VKIRAAMLLSVIRRLKRRRVILHVVFRKVSRSPRDPVVRMILDFLTMDAAPAFDPVVTFLGDGACPKNRSAPAHSRELDRRSTLAPPAAHAS
jgi:hypothetical protein